MTTAAPVLRPYRSPDDASATLATCRRAIGVSAAEVYTPEQVAAWLGPDDVDLAAWDARRRAAWAVVAEVDGALVGFADLLPEGLVDMLFVHPVAGGRGVARALLTAVEAEARARGLTGLRTYASRRARPVFERLGWGVTVDRQDNTVRGVVVPNVEMRRDLTEPDGSLSDRWDEPPARPGRLRP